MPRLTRPTVRIEPEICDDPVDKVRHGKEIGTNFRVGTDADDTYAYVSNDATKVLNTPTVYVLGEEFELADIARILPSLCALMADETLQTAAQQWHERHVAFMASLPPPPAALLAILERAGVSLEQFEDAIDAEPLILDVMLAALK